MPGNNSNKIKTQAIVLLLFCKEVYLGLDLSESFMSCQFVSSQFDQKHPTKT